MAPSRPDAPAPAVDSGERKQVSVLFADVVGSMLLAERLDAERLRVVMAELTRRCAQCVTRFEGMVDKFTGDGIMALFGAPVALEDHARRACYAGLEMQRAVAAYAGELKEAEGIELALRVGINSGEVIVGDIATAERFTYTAIGHTVGLAQRMESLAAPGSVYLTGHAARLAQGYLALRELGPRQVKGSSRPIPVFELVGLGTARGHIDVARGRGLTRFVGREAELRELNDALTRAQNGDGQVVGITADPGLGKSRLVTEFIQDIRKQGIEVHEAHCQAHARALPLMPVLEMMRSYFGITDDLDALAARACIEQRVQQVDARLVGELPLLFEFLAVPDPDRPVGTIDPEARRRRLLELTRRLVHAPGRQQAVVHVIEDAHWIDPASDEFLASLVEATARSHSLVVVAFRPEYAASWMRRSWYRQLPLSPLAPAVVTSLLAELLGPDPSLDGLTELIAQRTGGNPFFLEEVVRHLAETGVLAGERGCYRLAGEIARVAVPDTVQAVLTARIDRLGGSAKELLAAAAVIGREFDRDLLERVAHIRPGELDSLLERLVEAELISQTEVYPVAVYAFRHPLTHEVTLGSLLSERRRELHSRAAAAIAELHTERPGEVAALIAQHYEQAGLVLEACTWYLTAATWAMVNDQPATIGQLDRITALDHDLPDGPQSDLLRATARTLLLSIGWRVGSDLRHMRRIYTDSVAAATRVQDDRLLAIAQISLGGCVMKAGHLNGATELFTKALHTARRSGDPGLFATAQAVASNIYFLVGRLRDALDAADAALEITADQPELNAGGSVFESPRAVAQLFRALVLAALGLTSKAQTALDENEAFIRNHGFAETLCFHDGFRSLVLRVAGGAVDDIGFAFEAQAIAESVGGQAVKNMAQSTLSAAHLAAGQSVEAAEAAQRCIALTETTNTQREYEPVARQLRALALAATGDPHEGMAEAERAIFCCAEQGNRFFTPWSCAAFAAAAAAAGSELDRALQVLDDGERVAAETGARGFLPELLDARAHVHAARGEHDARRETLQRGLQVARENQAQGWVKRFEDALAGILTDGRYDGLDSAVTPSAATQVSATTTPNGPESAARGVGQ